MTPNEKTDHGDKWLRTKLLAPVGRSTLELEVTLRLNADAFTRS